MAFTQVTLTGKVLLSNAAAASGASVTFTLNTPISDGTQIIAPAALTARCAADGSFTIGLNANDDTTTTPTGTYYTVVITYENQQLDTFNVIVPKAAAPTVSLFSLATLSNPNVQTPYVTSFGGRNGIVVPANTDYLAVTSGGLPGATTPTRFVGATTSGPPVSGTFLPGDWVLVVSGTPSIQVCTAGGSPGTWAAFSGGGAVASVFTRTGAVVAQSGDYTAAQVTSAADKSAASQQAFTGEVASPDFKPTGLTGAVSASRYVGATALGAPTTGTFLLGDWVTDQAGKRWTCTVAGNPGTWAQEPGTGGGGSAPTIQGAQSTNFGATQTVNFAGTASEIWLVGTFNANLVVTVSNRVAGCRLRIQGLQDGTGGRTLTISDGTNSQSVTIASAASAYTEVLVDCPDATNVNASVVGANGPVSSVFGRTAAVVATTGDYTAAQVTSAADKSAASQQAFTGEVAAPDFSATGLTGATAASRHVGGTASGAPVSGAFLKGDFVIDQSGKVWVCTTAGSPGTWGQIGGGATSYVGVFGDGSDGALTFDGTSTVAGLVPASNIYVMTADLHATSITVNAGVTLQPAGFRILCQGTVTNNGTISANGGNAVGATLGGGGTAGTLGTGGAGAAGGTGAGVGGSGGFAGGKGGAGGTSGGNAGGAAGNATLNTAALAKSYLFTPGPVLAGLVAQTGSSKVLAGGSGGGSGGGDGTNPGGGGGGGAGIIAILAHAIVNSGTISANGGNGGNAAGAGTAAGGGGGGGGPVLGYTLSAWTAGTINVNGGAAGTGGSGTGASGNPGNAGYSQNVVLA